MNSSILKGFIDFLLGACLLFLPHEVLHADFSSRLGFDPYKDYYAILNIPKDSDLDAARSAYRKIARENHPDLHPNDEEARKRFEAANEAWNVINDADKKRLYDIERARILGDIQYRASTANLTEEEALREELFELIRGISVDQAIRRDALYFEKMKAYGKLLIENRPLKRAFFKWAELGMEDGSRVLHSSAAIKEEAIKFLDLLRTNSQLHIAEGYENRARAYVANAIFQYDLFERTFLASLKRKMERGQWDHISDPLAEEVLLAETSQVFRLGFIFRNLGQLFSRFGSLFMRNPGFWYDSFQEFKFYLNQSQIPLEPDQILEIDQLTRALYNAPVESKWRQTTRVCSLYIQRVVHSVKRLKNKI